MFIYGEILILWGFHPTYVKYQSCHSSRFPDDDDDDDDDMSHHEL